MPHSADALVYSEEPGTGIPPRSRCTTEIGLRQPSPALIFASMLSAADLILEPFVPRRGLKGAHAQTLASYFLPRSNSLPNPENRLVRVEEQTQLLCQCHWQPERTRTLTVVVIHGLDGSSASPGVVGVSGKAWAAGMSVVRMNMRNCGGTEALTPTLYHSGLFRDLAATVETLIREESLQRIAVAGFSAGGNLVLNLVGHWGGAGPPELAAAAAVCPVMDVAPSADALHEWSNRLYEWKFLTSCVGLFRRKVRLFPERYDRSRRLRFGSLREFDEVITGPYMGFRGADDLYAEISSSRVADRISIPTLIIHSQDDPFIRILPATRQKLLRNEQVQYLETERGGHCAFLAPPDGYDGRWAEKTVVEFLRRF